MAKYAQLTATGLPHGVLLTITDTSGKQVSNLYPEANSVAPDNRPRFADGTGAISPDTYVPNGTYLVTYSGGSQTVVVSGGTGSPADSMFVDMVTQAELDADNTAESSTYGTPVYTTGTRPAATGSGIVIWVSDLNGGTLQKDTGTGVWTSLAPGATVLSGAEIAYAENVTGTKQTLAIPLGSTATIDVTGCTLTVPATTKPVLITGRVVYQQTVTGVGDVYLHIVDTTSGGSTALEYDVKPLPNLASGGTNGGTFFSSRVTTRIAASGSTRTYKLSVLGLAATTSTPTVQVQNTATTGSAIHAVAL